MSGKSAASWPEARSLAARARPGPIRTVPIGEADGRVLAADITARCDLPAFDTSAMDGWAVRGSGPWRLRSETVLAGSDREMALAAGEASTIATGARVPAGAFAILRSEHGEVSGEYVRATELVPAGAHIRPQGEEVTAGEVLVAAGTTITPAGVGLAAAAGNDVVEVRDRPRVAVVVLGDELVFSGIAPVGFVRDALGVQLPGWLSRLGAECVGTFRAADTLADHSEVISRARQCADVVITTGGTAAGPVDHVHAVVTDMGGRFLVDSVAVRPGHPMALASWVPPADRFGEPGSGAGSADTTGPGAGWLLALPGNPQSAIVGLLTLGQPLLDGLLGRPQRQLGRVRIGADVAAPAHEHRLVACSLDRATARPVQHLGSAMLRGLTRAHGFAVVPPGGALASAELMWIPLPGIGDSYEGISAFERP